MQNRQVERGAVLALNPDRLWASRPFDTPDARAPAMRLHYHLTTSARSLDAALGNALAAGFTPVSAAVDSSQRMSWDGVSEPSTTYLTPHSAPVWQSYRVAGTGVRVHP